MCYYNDKPEVVAPRRGAWIEITVAKWEAGESFVAPRRGAWIEIADQRPIA